MEINRGSRDANVALVEKLYLALESGDVGAIVALVSDSIVVHVADSPLRGVYTGRSEVDGLYRSIVDAMGAGFSVPEHEFLVHDESLVVYPRGAGASRGDTGFDVYHFTERQISEIWLTVWGVGD